MKNKLKVIANRIEDYQQQIEALRYERDLQIREYLWKHHQIKISERYVNNKFVFHKPTHYRLLEEGDKTFIVLKGWKPGAFWISNTEWEETENEYEIQRVEVL